MKLKSLVLIDIDSVELRFTICGMMVYYEKRLTEIKRHIEWDSNHWPHASWLMAA